MHHSLQRNHLYGYISSNYDTRLRAAHQSHMFQTSATELSHMITAKRWPHYPDTHIISGALTPTNSTG
jgi:hypothetical protein